MPEDKEKIFLTALKGSRPQRVPFWFMRQAGRYLPEYLDTRAKAGGFLDLVYTPELAAEVTLQPIRRYGMSAAILFSDILVIPDALGQKVWFEEKKGPQLEPVVCAQDITRLSITNLRPHLAPVYETLSRVSEALPDDVALIGFAGAPWTVATYMVEGSGSPDQAAAKNWARNDETSFREMMELLVEATANYLIDQVDAGAEALQIFDTWAGGLKGDDFQKWVIQPTTEIVARVKAACPDVPIIGFPKGANELYSEYVTKTGISGISIDWDVRPDWAATHLQPLATVQGNLDPKLLVEGGDRMIEAAREILIALKNGPHIFNLGHGITPDVPPEHVAALSEFLKSWRIDG